MTSTVYQKLLLIINTFLLEPREKICGNYKKESGEECDPGNLGTIASACCTKDCKLKEKAECRQVEQLISLLVSQLVVH